MDAQSPRMTEAGGPPALDDVAAWLGRKAYGRWARIVRMIDRDYAGVFTPPWLFGGKKHGWSLRYKKSKSFCTLIPERSRCRLLIVFGAEERSGVKAIRRDLTPRTRRAYDAATTYHDGKWLVLDVDTNAAVADVKLLLGVKRRPKARAKEQGPPE